MGNLSARGGSDSGSDWVRLSSDSERTTGSTKTRQPVTERSLADAPTNVASLAWFSLSGATTSDSRPIRPARYRLSTATALTLPTAWSQTETAARSRIAIHTLAQGEEEEASFYGRAFSTDEWASSESLQSKFSTMSLDDYTPGYPDHLQELIVPGLPAAQDDDNASRISELDGGTRICDELTDLIQEISQRGSPASLDHQGCISALSSFGSHIYGLHWSLHGVSGVRRDLLFRSLLWRHNAADAQRIAGLPSFTWFGWRIPERSLHLDWSSAIRSPAFCGNGAYERKDTTSRCDVPAAEILSTTHMSPEAEMLDLKGTPMPCQIHQRARCEEVSVTFLDRNRSRPHSAKKWFTRVVAGTAQTVNEGRHWSPSSTLRVAFDNRANEQEGDGRYAILPLVEERDSPHVLGPDTYVIECLLLKHIGGGVDAAGSWVPSFERAGLATMVLESFRYKVLKNVLGQQVYTKVCLV